jgi:phosphopantothenoylcysteine decarboxylase/phosphopantothenate--cysteine ligase
MSKIVIGVSGGIAAFKSAALVSELVQRGHDVDVVMTHAAKEFVGPATFTALTGRPVTLETFDSRFPLGAHIELAQGADVLCVAPATANFLSKAAQGLADDLLSTLYLCCTAPICMAPAMNNEMWSKPAVQRNLAQLKSDGVCIIDPQVGWLSCRTEGVGRMAEPVAIREAIEKAGSSGG